MNLYRFTRPGQRAGFFVAVDLWMSQKQTRTRHPAFVSNAGAPALDTSIQARAVGTFTPRYRSSDGCIGKVRG